LASASSPADRCPMALANLPPSISRWPRLRLWSASGGGGVGSDQGDLDGGLILWVLPAPPRRGGQLEHQFHRPDRHRASLERQDRIEGVAYGSQSTRRDLGLLRQLSKHSDRAQQRARAGRPPGARALRRLQRRRRRGQRASGARRPCS
jgi:hypothetical protein